MRCLDPKNMPRPNGRGSFDRINVPCRMCIECLKEDRAEWSFRLQEEWRESSSAYFVTLTYNDDWLPLKASDADRTLHYTELLDVMMKGGEDADGTNLMYVPTLLKSDLKAFLKRLKADQDFVEGKYYSEEKDAQRALKWPVRYFATGEYGEKSGRPHYHALIFNLRPETKLRLPDKWKFGYVDIGDCDYASIEYVCKYLLKGGKQPCGSFEPFRIMSRGIGYNYMTRMSKWHKENMIGYVQTKEGKNQNMPRKFKDSIFNDKERNKLTEKNLDYSRKRQAKAINEEGSFQYFKKKHLNTENALRRKRDSLNNSKF